DFSFSDTYAPLDFGAMRGCEARVWSVFNQAGCDVDKYLDYAMGYNAKNRMPLYMKAPKKLSPKQVADFMRDHYDGTAMDMHTDIGAGGEETPYRWRPMSFESNGKTYLNERAIATQQTGWWMMGQARNWLPDEIGAVLWFGVDDAATSCLTPMYVASTRVPECFRVGNGNMTQYSPTAAFWMFNRVAQFAYLRYKTLLPEIKKVYDAHENGAMQNSTVVDNKAKELLAKSKSEAAKFLTEYSIETAQNMFNKWSDLDKYLMVKYIDGNVKKENEGGFIDNGNKCNIPTMPNFPGYSQKWKDAVAKDTGDKLISK
ncbi:MAG: C69 family dipeptidase, partial [Rikenellaceae bacterium]